jgi:hypothetical protein
MKTLQGERIYWVYQPEAQGLVYPTMATVIKTDDMFEVWDTTGWTGHETCDPQWLASFWNEAAARQYADQFVRFSDTEGVFQAALALLDGEPEAFEKLKDAVAWQDRR